MRVVWGTVRQVTMNRQGLQRLLVEVPGADDSLSSLAADISSSTGAACQTRRAICYPALTGTCKVGDLVALNTTACDLDLGTGGWDVVCAVATRAAGTPESDERSFGLPVGFSSHETPSGHIMKLRYTPCQVNVASVEEQGSPLHEALADADDCHGMPVVCCELHSQAMAALAAIASAEIDAPVVQEDQGLNQPLRVAYIMTDEAALHLGLSEVCARLRADGVISFTLTCGQATGGEYEAVTLHSALIAAHLLGAQLAVVSQGPGIVGTATRFGHSGLAQGEAINACAVVGARPVAALRLSAADARARHKGLSHHSATALGRVALAPALIALPDGLEPEEYAQVRESLSSSGIGRLHQLVDVAVSPDVLEAVAQEGITTMGRTVASDPIFFRAACAAGLLAHKIARGQR